jgi:YHS domain-containing protein
MPGQTGVPPAFSPDGMKYFLHISIAALLALWVGCATSANDAVQSSGPGEICHVCRYNNDLACVCVRVNENTPRAQHHGRTFYFCSDDCRTAFLKKPQKYQPRP